MLFESENVEFKSVFTADLYKEVIAFANMLLPITAEV